MQAGTDRRRIGGARLIDTGEPLHPSARLPGAAAQRIGQNRSHQGCLTGAEFPHGLAERAAGAGLGAELAVGTPFGDIEVDFQNALFRQDQIDP